MSMRPSKSEIVPGLILATASGRYSEVMVVQAPTSRGMVLCEVFARDGSTRTVSLPMQSLRWF